MAYFTRSTDARHRQSVVLKEDASSAKNFTIAKRFADPASSPAQGSLLALMSLEM